MRKYLFAVTDYPPRIGGVARYHAAVTHALGDAVTVHRVAHDRHWLRLPRQLHRIARVQRADALLVGEVLPVGTGAYLIHVLHRTPYAVICHGLDLRSAQRIPRKRWLARRILRNADRVVVNSAFTHDLALAAGARADRTSIVHPPLGITPDLAQPAPVVDVRRAGGLEHSRIILSVGRLVARKGFDDLIRAVTLLHREFPRVVLVIVGGGPERERLGALARAEGLAVRFIPPCDDATLAAWYRACDVFALLPHELPSGDVEGFGMVYLEAGAFGKPVIGTRSGGVSDAVQDGATGILVPPGDPAAACAAIAELLRDPATARHLGANGAAAAAQRNTEFSAELRSALL